MFREDAKNTKKCKSNVQNKATYGGNVCFRKKIPFFGYENFVEDSNNLAKKGENFTFKNTYSDLDVNFEKFWRKRKSNEKGTP
jgi:hypothetical protein